MAASAQSDGSRKFPDAQSAENFIRSYLRLIEMESVPSVDVLLEPPLLLEFRNEAHGLVG
jgi:hypothetical protein